MAGKIQPSEYNLEYIRLVNYKGDRIDLTFAFISMSYYESIYDSFISGSVIFKDALDVSENFPLNGEETIEMS